MRETSLFINGTATGITVEIARTPFERMRGLMGRRSFGGMLIDPCNSIHTFFMAVPIDAVFLDHAGRIVRVLPGVRPWRIPLPVFTARRVLELPTGSADKLNVRPGDVLTFTE